MSRPLSTLRSRPERNALTLLFAALVAAAVSMIAMFGFQTQLIFPTHAVGPPGPLPRGAERLELKTPDGETLRGVHFPPEKPELDSGTLILGFAGNAWNSQDAAGLLRDLYPEAHVVAFHYRGYSPSTGSPSAEALIADAPLVYDRAVKLAKPKRVVAVGFSIGSGIAAQLAAKRRLDGLVLVTPFDSLKAVAQSLYPWMPVGPLFKHEIDAASALEQSQVPVAIVAGETDEIVAPARTAALRARAGNLAYDRTIPGAGHNDIYSHAEFRGAMRKALAAVGSSP